jgi:putrescine transport system substrate-binding protein
MSLHRGRCRTRFAGGFRTACAAVAVLVAGCAPDADPAAAPRAPTAAAGSNVVNVYAWADYVPRDLLAKFEAETGIAVNADVYDSNLALEARLMTGRSGYDVGVPSASSAARGRRLGLFEPLALASIGRWGSLDPLLLQALARTDPGPVQGVPYFWGTTGIGYDTVRVQQALGRPIESWFDVLDPANAAKLQGCGIALLDDAVDVLLAVMIALGHDVAEQDAAEIAAAEAQLAQLRPYVRYFNSSQYIADLAKGEVCVVIGYSGDVEKARRAAIQSRSGASIAYTVGEEGALLWMDVLAVPSGAPNAANAHRFIDFMLRPEIAAEISNRAGFANSVPDSKPLLEPQLRDSEAAYPPPEVRARLVPSPRVSDEGLRAMTRAWTRIKTGT